jgi:hypothetical protein
VEDARIRELARQEDPEERGRMLRELVRSGQLSEDRLRLLAYLGDPGARQVAEPPEPPRGLTALRARLRKGWDGLHSVEPPWDMDGSEDWTVGLAFWGHEVVARAYLAVEPLERPEVPPDADSETLASVERDREALALVERWVLNGGPLPSRLNEMVEARQADWEFGAPPPSPLDFVRDLDPHVMSCNVALAFEVPEDRTRVREELAPWILGLHDPVAERAQRSS